MMSNSESRKREASVTPVREPDEAAVAELIHRSDCGCPDWQADDQEDQTYREHARAILASPWLAQHTAKVKAEAWDEGFDAGEKDVWNHEQAGWRENDPCIPNPYREAAQ